MIDRPKWTVLDEASFASVRVDLPPGRHVHCESDAVVSLSDGVNVSGILSGGFFSALARLFLTQESFFVTKVESTPATETVGDVLLAPPRPGGIVLHQLHHGDDLLLIKGAYLAADASIDVSSRIQKGITNSVFSGTGFFLLRASGHGTLAVAAYGAIHKYELRPGEQRAVDNGHLVAWTASMDYRTRMANRSGMVGSFTSGEGLMCYFTGPGTIYLQSHKERVETRPANSSRRGNRDVGLCGAIIAFGIFFAILTIWLVVAFNTGELYFTTSSSNSYHEYENYERAGGSYGYQRTYEL